MYGLKLYASKESLPVARPVAKYAAREVSHFHRRRQTSEQPSQVKPPVKKHNIYIKGIDSKLSGASADLAQ